MNKKTANKDDMVEITIKVDTNDADYMTEVSIITKTQLDELLPLIAKINEFNQSNKKGHGLHNFPYGDACHKESTPEELYDLDEYTMDLFTSLLPSCEYGCHTIESIFISPVVEKTRLL